MKLKKIDTLEELCTALENRQKVCNEKGQEYNIAMDWPADMPFGFAKDLIAEGVYIKEDPVPPVCPYCHEPMELCRNTIFGPGSTLYYYECVNAECDRKIMGPACDTPGEAAEAMRLPTLTDEKIKEETSYIERTHGKEQACFYRDGLKRARMFYELQGRRQ